MIQFNWKLFFCQRRISHKALSRKFLASAHHHKTKNFSPHFSKIETVRKNKTILGQKKNKKKKQDSKREFPSMNQLIQIV